MSDALESDEPTFPLLYPLHNRDGSVSAAVPMTQKAIKTRAALDIPPWKTLPVIVVPGIMGSNLCATTSPSKEKNKALKPGEPAWRPPNGKIEGANEARKWELFSAKDRQQVLDPATLDVDDRGKFAFSSEASKLLGKDTARRRGWGKVHWDSYGRLLCDLETSLNAPLFAINELRFASALWTNANRIDRAQWATSSKGPMAPLSTKDLEHLCEFHHPVYAFGYNWLESCEKSAESLKEFIGSVMAEWTFPGRRCRPVILVTHSMGGLVARACAKMIPDRIAGIVHGVMPALGAPVAYRRIACGVETTKPGRLTTFKDTAFADITGATTEMTTPVLALAPGALELLPNHLYPGPWLSATLARENNAPAEVLHLPKGNPYDFYRDTTSWYRMIDPALVDPAGKFKGNSDKIDTKILAGIRQAEKFHTKILGTYYHPNTYAFYGADGGQFSFGKFCWQGGEAKGLMSIDILTNGKLMSHTNEGARLVEVEGGRTLHFKPSMQDVRGDGTVPEHSGAGPEGKVKQVFRTSGYTHQGCFNNDAMYYLTQHLIARIIMEVK